MARQKSDLLGALGAAFQIVKAIVEAVQDRGGSDEDVRLILKDAGVCGKIADLLVRVRTVFTVPNINYDDPRWRSLKGDYYFSNTDLRPEHFPISRKGVGEVVMEYVVFDHEPTTQEALDCINGRSDLRLPDRAETEKFLDQNDQERKKFPIIGLCGSVVERSGDRSVACVFAGGDGRYLVFDWLGGHWDQHCRFLAVRK